MEFSDQNAKPAVEIEHLIKAVNVDEADEKLIPNLSNICKVLQPVNYLPVLAIAIIGPNSSDKASVFNSLIKALQNLENGQGDVDVGVLAGKENTGPVTKSSCSQPGVYSTNQTFQVTVGNAKNKKEIAILPLYVQPSNELDWNTENSLIFSLIGLVLQISSTAIFNIHKRLSEQTITAIANFLKHATQNLPSNRVSSQKKKITKPFNKAVFLIRDWNFPSEFAYGLSGGLQFVQQEKLKSKENQTRVSWQNRQIINGLYQEIIGCLLPFSGKNIGEETGSYSPEFSKYLKQLIGNLLDFELSNVQNLPTGKSLMSLLETYGKSHKETQINPMHVIRRFGIQIQFSTGAMQEFIKDAVQVYENICTKFVKDKAFLHEKALRDIHVKASKKAGDFYKLAIFPENEDDIDDDDEYDEEESPLFEFYEMGRKLLLEALKKQYNIKKDQNVERKTAYLEAINANLLEQYVNLMKSNVTGNKSADMLAERQSKACIANIREEYLEKIGVDGDFDEMNEDEEQNMNKLLSLLAEEENRMLLQIGHQQTKNDSIAR